MPGRKIRKIDSKAAETTVYYHNDNWQVVCEYDGSDTYQRHFIYGNYIDGVLFMWELIRSYIFQTGLIPWTSKKEGLSYNCCKHCRNSGVDIEHQWKAGIAGVSIEVGATISGEIKVCANHGG